MLSILENTIKKQIVSDYPYHSRVHHLKTFNSNDLRCYVKRDDELGLHGSKFRKFGSLIAYLIEHNVEEVIVIGGANSNHVLGISQLLNENHIPCRLFLCQTKQDKLQGNALLTKILVPESQIHWIAREQWKHVNEMAADYANKLFPQKKLFIIPEGGCTPEALPGALTLPCDILSNEKQLDFKFDHFFVDSGTGITAMALILGLAFIQHPGHIHVTLMAGHPDLFLLKLKEYQSHFSSLMKTNCPWPKSFSLSKPLQAKAFGSTNAKTFEAIKAIARDEGILCDPIYNAKLFQEAKRKILKENLQGKALIIQSGGTLSLLGFTDFF